MEQLFGDATAAGADSVALIDAVALASESVRQGDDPNAVLGASLVLLATGASIAGDLDALERLAHAGAVGGVPLSVVRLSDRAELDDIDRLVAAGQGNRRILDTADQADALIDRELHSASRAVARAVRLRIKLAPGVKLVEVLGSRRLEGRAGRARARGRTGARSAARAQPRHRGRPGRRRGRHPDRHPVVLCRRRACHLARRRRRRPQGRSPT